MNRKNRKWTPEEVEYLRANYHKETAKDIAKKLDRSVKTVSEKARAIGLRKQSLVPQEEYLSNFVATERFIRDFEVVHLRKPVCDECGEKIKPGVRLSWVFYRDGRKKLICAGGCFRDREVI